MSGSYNYKMFGCFNRKFKTIDVGPPPDIIKAFIIYSGGTTQISSDQLLRYLVEYHGEGNYNIMDAEELLQHVLNQRHNLAKYTRNTLDVDDFLFLLVQDEFNPPIRSQVHQDMTAPLQHYFIYTGHNSYLTGNQLSSDCSDVPIINALERGVRGIELDLWPNSTKDDIDVLHGRTLTTPVKLDKCFQSIKEHAFVKSPYPVIVTLEDHLNPSLRAKVAEMAIRIFGELLYYPEPGCFNEFPSPEELKHRIILSTKPPKEYLESKSFKEKDIASPLRKDKDNASSLKKDTTAEELWDKNDDTQQGESDSDSDDLDELNEGGSAKFNKSSEPGKTDEHTEDRGTGSKKSSNLEKTDKHSEVFNVDKQNSSQLRTTDKHLEDCNTDIHRSDQLGEPLEHSEGNSIVKKHPNQIETPEQEHSLADETRNFDKNDDGPDIHLVNTRQHQQLVLTGRKPLSSLLDGGDQWNDEDQTNVDDEGKQFHFTASAYKHLIAIHADKPREGLRRTLILGVDKVRRLSLSEVELARAAESYGTDIIRFTQKNLVRVYPKGTRVTSSNFRPLTGWMVGAQMVAFNMQGYGKSLWLMHGMFRANGGCGYVKKPRCLMTKDPNEVFDPKEILPVKKTLKVKVYLGDGWHLDFSPTHFDAYSPPDFYTKVSIVGVPADIANYRTRIIEDDWTPTWDEEFEFPLTVPELALLQIVVLEYDMSEKDDFGGQTCLPVSELRPGIRAVPLYDRKGTKYKSVKLLMRFQFV